MQVRIEKWEDGLALRLPQSLVNELHLNLGTWVDVSLQAGHLVVTPPDQAITLEQLLADVHPENLHSEIEVGDAVGSEVWSG